MAGLPGVYVFSESEGSVTSTYIQKSNHWCKRRNQFDAQVACTLGINER